MDNGTDGPHVIPFRTGPETPAATAPSEQLALAAGTLLAGRYELLQLAAVGGTSLVYRATDRRAAAAGCGDPEIAVKVPHAMPDTATARELAQREALWSRKLRHPGLVAIYGAERHGRIWFVTLEWLVGETLAEAMLRQAAGAFGRRRTETLISAVADALDYCHERGLIHSDVKPGNILLSHAGEVRLLDFATARPTGDRRGRTPRAGREPFTGYSPAYASPGILRGHRADARDDVFSLACVAYRMLTGVHPFNGRPADLAEKAGMTPPQHPALGYWQWRVLSRGLRFDPERRYPSAGALAAGLRRAGRLPALRRRPSP